MSETQTEIINEILFIWFVRNISLNLWEFLFFFNENDLQKKKSKKESSFRVENKI